jgi:spore coat protein B
MNYDLLSALVGHVVRIDRGGPESRTGMLLAVADDHLTLLTEKDGVVYYKHQHVKSVTKHSKNKLKFGMEIPEDMEYKKAESFNSLLTDLQYEWVKINRGGPESIEGILNESNDDYATIVKNEEVVRLSMYHIRNISYGEKVENESKDEDKGEQSSEANNEQKSENKSEQNNEQNFEKKFQQIFQRSAFTK